MNTQTFTSEQFFDISGFSYLEIFSGKTNVWETIPALQEFIIALFEKGIVKGNYKEKYVFIGDGAVIEEGAVIKGPCIVGKNSVIGHSAFLRESCLIGDNVHIGHAVEVKNSIFLNNSHAAHLNYIGDSIIGNRVNIAAGAILTNFRLDHKTIMVKTEEQTIDTNLTKLGSIIGDDSNIGANAVLNPGTILEKNVIVYPLTSVRGVHAMGSVVR